MLSYFELIFVYGVREGSNSFACGNPVVSSLPLKKLLSPLNGLAIFIKTQVAPDVWVFFFNLFFCFVLRQGLPVLPRLVSNS
jgi:hypothetical protein